MSLGPAHPVAAASGPDPLPLTLPWSPTVWPPAPWDRPIPGSSQATEQRHPEADTLTGLPFGAALLPPAIAPGPLLFLEEEGAIAQIQGLQRLSSYPGELSPKDDYNALRQAAFKDDFWLHIGETRKIQLSLTSSDFDPYLQLIDGDSGAVVAFDDDSGDGLNAKLKRAVAAGDRFIVRVTSYGPYETGNYRLSLSADGSPGSLDPTPDPTAPGPIHGPGDSGLDGTLPPDPAQFQARTGYGLVDGAAAVAAALSLGQTDRPEPPAPVRAIADLGGVNSGLDLLQVPEVWAQGFTGAGVVVAVIDSGLDLSHPELQGSLWTNGGEIAGDGLDNDQNGYVDDLHGWNFGEGQLNGDVSPGTSSRFQGHGTHVAGIIAGANDGLGNSGVAYDAQIMALRLGDTNDAGAFLNPGDLAQAIRYAADNGAQVINLSLGWSDSPALQQALAYAAQRNAIVVSAAGNSGGSLPVPPARYATDWGISVGAVSRSGSLASFSNGAGQISTLRHVLAPGTSITSAEPGGGYESRTGTSMAAPYVSGVAALMLSANPHLTPDQVRDILARTAIQPDRLGR